MRAGRSQGDIVGARLTATMRREQALDLITLLIVLIVAIAILGVLVWFVTTSIPMPQPFRNGIYAVAAIIALLIILKLVVGGLPPLLVLPVVTYG